MLTRIIGRQIGKRLAKKAIRTAAQKRALRKAVLASAKARAKKVGGMALAGPKAYARSVVKRSAGRKNKVLNKITKKKLIQDNKISRLSKDLTKISRESSIVKKENIADMKKLEQSLESYKKITSKPMFKNPVFENIRRKRITKKIQKETARIRGGNEILRRNQELSLTLEGLKAESQNASEFLANKYAKTSGQNLRFKAGTVARDLTGVSVIGGAGYGAYKYNKQRKKKA